MFRHVAISPGERIAGILYSTLSEGRLMFTPYVDLDRLPHGFHHYADAARTLFTLRNLILHAEHEIESLNWDYNLAVRPISNLLLGVGLRHADKDGALARLVCEAVRAGRHGISERLKETAYEFAERKHRFCYICGRSISFAINGPQIGGESCTLDHLWPQCLGGDSTDRNLLPACKGCNSERKRNIAHWGGVPLQALHLGVSPSEEALISVEWTLKWALHCRAVFDLAEEKSLDLWTAFQRIGVLPSMQGLEFYETDEPGHFFNLSLNPI